MRPPADRRAGPCDRRERARGERLLANLRAAQVDWSSIERLGVIQMLMQEALHDGTPIETLQAQVELLGVAPTPKPADDFVNAPGSWRDPSVQRARS